MSDVAIRNIPTAAVTIHPGNRKKLEIADLAESLKKRGQLQPILVHALPKKKNEYELIAGERRLRAALEIGWPDIEAKVFENLDESEIREIRLIENLQREDLTVWEEAEHLAELQKLQPTARVEDLAVKVGRGPQWVASRLATNRVIPKLRELIAGQNWPLGHVALLARVPTERQPDVLAEIIREQKEGYNWSDRGGAPSLSELRDFLESTQGILDSAPWAQDDAKLVPKAGTCNACHKRSNAQPFLFPELSTDKEDRCLDPVCWNEKQIAFVALSVNKLKEEGKAPVFAKSYSPVSKPIAAALGVKDEPKSVYDFDECKKTDPKAVPVVLIDEQNGGKIQYMKPKAANNGHASHKNGKAHRPIDQETGKPAQPSSKERLASLKAKRQCLAVELWNEKLPKLKPKFKGLVEDLVVFFGTQSAKRARLPQDWLAFGALKSKIDDDAWKQLAPVFQDRLNRFGPIEEQADGLWKEARAQASALNFEKDLKDCWHEAVKEAPLSKVLKDEGVADSVGAMP